MNWICGTEFAEVSGFSSANLIKDAYKGKKTQNN